MGREQGAGQLDLNSIRLFLLAAEYQSMARAAEALSIPRSKVSRHIKRLEDALGFALINRDVTKLALTGAGATLVQQFRPLFQELNHAELSMRDLAEQPAGLLRVSVPTDLLNNDFAYSLADFQKLNPAIQLQCHGSSHFDRFAMDDFDVALLINAHRLPDGNYLSRKLFDVQCGVFAAPEFLSNTDLGEDIQQLERAPCISHTFNHHWAFFHQQKEVSVGVNAVFQVDSIVAAKMAAIQGLGVARLPKFICQEECQQGLLTEVQFNQPEGYASLPYQVSVAYLDRQLQPAKVKAFIEYYQRAAPDMGV